MFFRRRLRLFLGALLFAGAPSALFLTAGVGPTGLAALLLLLAALATAKLVLDWPSRQRWPLT